MGKPVSKLVGHGSLRISDMQGNYKKPGFSRILFGINRA